MKNIYINSNGKVNKNIKISLISDLHIKDTTEYLRTLKLIKKIKKVNPDYILILGDICDKAKIDKNTLHMIYDILLKLSNIATTYSVLGNHDLMKINSDNWEECIDKKYLNMLDSINNFKVIKDETIVLNNFISLTGVILPYSYYYKYNEEEDAFNKVLDNSINNGLFNNYNNKNFNIFLTHSPNNIFESDKYLNILKMFNKNTDKDINFNLIIAGHEHDGMVPNILSFLPGNRGIIGFKGKEKIYFKDNCRGIKNICDTHGIIVPSVNALTNKKKFIKTILNLFYKPKTYLLHIKI